jgi:hypothetical protein
VAAMVFAPTASAKDIWLGTAPFCNAKKSDCKNRGMTFVKTSKSGNGKRCTSGQKVLCRVPKGYSWMGRAPFCNASRKSCHQSGKVYVRSHKAGDGKSCTSGTKVLCRPWKFGDKQISTWKGTAPACEAQPTSCPSNMLYVKSSKRGDGKTCTSGQKVLCRTKSLKTSELSSWMSRASSKIGGKRINEIIIPGTHNSGTQPLRSKTAISADKSDNKWLKIVPASIIAAWARTQEYSVASQLSRGARSMDIRVCKKGKSYYTCHGKYGESLSSVLNSIKKFKNSNRREVIIVNVTHFYGFSGNYKQDHANVIRMIYNTFGKGADMVPAKSVFPKFNDVWKNNTQRLIVRYKAGDDYIKNNTKLKDRAKIATLLWPDSKFASSYACASDSSGWQSKSKLRNDQAKWIKGTKLSGCTTPSSSTMKIVTGDLTPNASNWTGAIGRWKPQNTVQLNQDINGSIVGWLNKEWKSSGGFILQLDGYGGTILHEEIVKKYIK